MHYYNYIGLGEFEKVYSNRQENDKGYLVEQTLTVHAISPVDPDKVTTMKYEYMVL